MILLVTVLFSGGFFLYSAMGEGILSSAFLLYTCRKGAKQRTPFRLSVKNGIPIALILYSFFVMLWAVDPVLQLEGSLKLLALLPWILLCYRMTEKERDRCLFLIPVAGAVMTGIGLFALTVQPLHEFFWQADRFGGFFQYANTCALFYLLGIVILCNRVLCGITMKTWKWIALLAALLIGILMTGSRSVLLLLLLWGVVKCIRAPRFRKPFLIVTIPLLFLLFLYTMLTGNLQNIGRIFSLPVYSSTVLGRVLYVRDGFKILGSFPFGLGSGGYAWIQPVYQNGVYSTQFVHNDYLQAALDYGILFAVVLIAYLIYELIRGKQGAEKKELLLLILAASFTDFHCQFLSILMIAAMCLDLGNRAGEKEPSARASKIGKIAPIVPVLLLVVFSYFLIPTVALQTHNDTVCLRMLPHETEAERRLLDEADTAEEAAYYAMEMLSHNPYVAEAYRHLGYLSAMKGDYESAVDAWNKKLDISRYNIESYREYDRLLDDLLMSAEMNGTGNDTVALLMKEKEALPLRLMELEKTTDPIAFQLRDKPDFEL